jgi:hypothetical protein
MQRADLVDIVADMLLSAAALWLAFGLTRAARNLDEYSARYWCAAFCSVGGSALFAAIWHGFGPVMDPRTIAMVWTASMAMAVAASFLFLIATLHVFTGGRLLGWLAGCAVVKFALFAIWASVKDDSRLAIYDIGLTMLAMLIMASWGAWTLRTRAAPWILAGVTTAMVGALFHQGRVSIHRYFNHNDLYHLMQIGALYFLYRAGPLLRDLDPMAPDFESTQRLPIVGEE